MSMKLHELKGEMNTLEVYEDQIIIKHNSLIGKALSGFKGDKSIYVSDITAIQIKKPGFVNGYIQFSFTGGVESTGGIFDAANDENTVFFSHQQYPYVLEIKQTIEFLRKRAKYPESGIHMEPTIEQTTQEDESRNFKKVADELIRFKQLLDDGVITPEEFESMKAKMLDI